MNIDFLLFSPPARNYKSTSLWGEVIFIPKTRKKEKKSSSWLSSFFSCQNVQTDSIVVEAQDEMTTEDDEQIQKYIPCLYLSSMVQSKYVVLYFHASGEDIKHAHALLNHVRNIYQVNVIAMEYPGYSLYKGSPCSATIKQDALYIYTYITAKIGFKQEHIIVMGRSIGTGVALDLLQKVNPAALVLISPFISVRHLASSFTGIIGELIALQQYENILCISNVKCPTFLVHGLKDQVISYLNTLELAKRCYCKTKVHTPKDMTHSAFDFYVDLTDPLRQFLMSEGINFYTRNMSGPIIPDYLFKFPKQFIF